MIPPKPTGSSSEVSETDGGFARAKGSGLPDEERVQQLLNSNKNYTLDVKVGQRKYGPAPTCLRPDPGSGCEVFVGKVPKEMFEYELVPIFARVGEIHNLRLMMDPQTGCNRGFCFVTYMNQDAAQRAVRELDGFEFARGKTLKVNISDPNRRLFVGNIPKSKGKEEILDEFRRITAGLTDVIIYSSPDDKKKNRGFAFLEYDSHKSANQAKRKLSSGRTKVWGLDIIVDWADPQEEPDPEIMNKVKVLYVRNLTQKVTEDELRLTFEKYGIIERVKKIKDYAFIHFADREKALQAMQELNGTPLGGAPLEVSLAKPPSDKKKKEDMLRRREMRMMHVMGPRPLDLLPPTSNAVMAPTVGSRPIGVGTRRGAVAGASSNPNLGALVTAPAAGPWYNPYAAQQDYSGLQEYGGPGGGGMDYYDGGSYGGAEFYDPAIVAAYYDYYNAYLDSFYAPGGMEEQAASPMYSGSESCSSRSMVAMGRKESHQKFRADNPGEASNSNGDQPECF